MWNDDRSFVVRVSLRLVALLGLTSAAWSLVILPAHFDTIEVRETAIRVLADDRFKRGVLDQVLARITERGAVPIQHPDVVRAEALVNLRASEEAMERKSSDEAVRDAPSAEQELKAALALNPADPFLWLMLYSVENKRNGLDPSGLRYLEYCYVTGPREGWVALRRNKSALAVFVMLGKAAQEKVISEFATLVGSDFIDDATINFTSVGWAHREQLLASLVSVDITLREAFAKRLARAGVVVSVPGIEVDQRGWR